jgi:hypothetical protein
MNILQDIMGLITKRKIKTPSDNDYIVSAAYTNVQEVLKPQPKMEASLLNIGALKKYIQDNAVSNLQKVTEVGAITTLPITANSFIKSGGASSEILAANGDVITAGTNITISGGVISSSGGGSSISLSAIGNAPNANAATLTGSVLNLQPASIDFGGVVTTGTQTFAGTKTFTGAISASNLSGTNTGDNATNSQYSGLATSKQDTLQNTVNIKSINGNTILGSGDLTISASTPSQSAYTILANNTASTAVPAQQGFRNEPSKAYAGATPTWTGTQAPSGTTNHTYSWSRMGNLVTLRVSLDYSVAGTSVSQVTFDLPSDCPIPELPSGVSVIADVINYGSGMLAATKVVPAAPTASYSAIRIKSTGVYEVNVGRGTAAAHRYAYATIQYFV